jgi:hypothetical protein
LVQPGHKWTETLAVTVPGSYLGRKWAADGELTGAAELLSFDLLDSSSIMHKLPVKETPVVHSTVELVTRMGEKQWCLNMAGQLWMSWDVQFNYEVRYLSERRDQSRKSRMKLAVIIIGPVLSQSIESEPSSSAQVKRLALLPRDLYFVQERLVIKCSPVEENSDTYGRGAGATF